MLEMTLEEKLKQRSALYANKSKLSKQLWPIEDEIRECDDVISELLMEQHGLERGMEIVITNEIQQYIGLRNWAQFAIDETIFVDGMEEAHCHELNDYPPQCKYIVILTDKIDGYTPFSDFNLSSSVLAGDKIGTRIQVPLEIVKEGITC